MEKIVTTAFMERQRPIVELVQTRRVKQVMVDPETGIERVFVYFVDEDGKKYFPATG